MPEREKPDRKLIIAIIILGVIAVTAAIIMSINSEGMIVAPGQDQVKTQALLE